MSLTWEEKLQNTEQKQEDRRQALEKMGISVQSSGIKVYRIYPYSLVVSRYTGYIHSV